MELGCLGMNHITGKVGTVAAVVLNYRGAEDTIACVQSLLKSESIKPEIIVVDNGSADGSAERIVQTFPGIKIIRSSANLGYAGGNNVGIKSAHTGGANYIFVVNNDCIVAPDALKKMVGAAMSRGAGVVSPKIFDFCNPKIIQCAGYKNLHLLAQGIPVGEGERDEGQYENEKYMNAAPGCALLLSRLLCEEVGLFDENFFAYSEELDLCRRACIRGFSILFVPKAHVLHKKAATLGKRSPEYLYFLTRGRLLYARKHLSWPAFLFIFLPYFVTIKLAKQLLISVFQGRWKNATALLKAVGWNLRDSLKFKVKG